MPLRFVHLVRHGQYSSEPELLTDVGRAQAALLAARIQGLGIQSVTSSTMPRARETAACLVRVLPDIRPTATSLLVEHVPTPPRRGRPPTWYNELPAEQREAWREQLEGAWRRFMKPTRARARHDVLVCHGNVIRALICRAMELDPGTWWDLRGPAHCSLSTVAVHRKGAMLTRFNDVGHLPPTMITQS